MVLRDWREWPETAGFTAVFGRDGCTGFPFSLILKDSREMDPKRRFTA